MKKGRFSTSSGTSSSAISCFSKEEMALVKKLPLPRHIAVIPDGNRRWARNRLCSTLRSGYRLGAEVIISILRAAISLGVKVLTIYAFSTENWGRPKNEIQLLFEFLEQYLQEYRSVMVEEGVRFGVIGNVEPFPESIKKEIRSTCEATESCERVDLVLALNYGARDEMLRAFLKMMADIEKGFLSRESVQEEVFARYLDTVPYGDPDLVIRTSGERRVSNFLLWQLAYAEFYVTDVLWPDFTPHDLLKAVLDFQQRVRRLGK